MAIQNDTNTTVQKWPARKYNFELALRYLEFGSQHEGLVLCLHGYQDHALSLLRRIGWQDSRPNFHVCAVNAPFPVPIWAADGFIEAYSWYFRDTSRGLEIFTPQQMATTLAQLLRDLDILKKPIVIFGFSQGGYLAAQLAVHLPNLKGIIGLGCGYRREIYEKFSATEVHAIHGALDKRIAVSEAESEFAEIQKLGHRGQFHRIENFDHRVDIQLEPLVRKLAEQMLAAK